MLDSIRSVLEEQRKLLESKCTAAAPAVRPGGVKFPLRDMALAQNANNNNTNDDGDNDSQLLRREMLQELRDSWNQHMQQSKPRLQPVGTKTLAKVKANIIGQLRTCDRKRKEVQHYVLTCSQAGPLSESPFACFEPLHRLWGACELYPKATMPELVQCLWHPERIAEFNAFIAASASDQQRLHNGLRLCLQLVVMETKLRRLKLIVEHLCNLSVSKVQDDVQVEVLRDLLTELRVTRQFDPVQHPQWLAYEADSGMQVRPEQYNVAATLLEEPGAIVQLNMGMGKTRVIVPLLALHWRQNPDCQVRLTFLSSLVAEAADYLRQSLTASSMLEVPIFSGPFTGTWS